MKLSLSSACLLAIASLVAAQDLTGLPTCASTCSLSRLTTTGCSLGDVDCICKAATYQAEVKKCVEEGCSADDIKKTEEFSKKICGDKLPGAAASSAVSSAKDKISSATAGAGSAAASASAAVSSAGSSVSEALSSATSRASAAISSAASLTASSTATATPNAAGNVLPGSAAGALGMAVLGLFL